MPKISIISPSNRKGALNGVGVCLKKQVFQDFEWLICTPQKEPQPISYTHLLEPEKKEGDFYNLNKALNKLISEASGELIVSIVDYTEFESDVLEKLWNYYQKNKKSGVSGIGYQYDKDKLVWTDPRISIVNGEGLCPMSPKHAEFRLMSFPRQAAFDVGGISEEYDKVAANSEKEFCTRMFAKGYDFFLDKNLVYKFYKHEDHGKIWDEKYMESCDMLANHMQEIMLGERLVLPYLSH